MPASGSNNEEKALSQGYVVAGDTPVATYKDGQPNANTYVASHIHARFQKLLTLPAVQEMRSKGGLEGSG